MRSRLPLVIATTSILFPTRIAAQEPPALAPRQRVRVTAPAAGLVRNIFAILSSSADSLIFVRQTSQAGLDTIRLPRAAVRTLEVSVHRGSYALVGLGLGLATGVVVAATWATNNDVGGGNFGPNFDNAPAIIGIVGAGAIAGAVGGGRIRTEKWRAVPADRVRVATTPPAGPRGSGAGPRF